MRIKGKKVGGLGKVVIESNEFTDRCACTGLSSDGGGRVKITIRGCSSVSAVSNSPLEDSTYSARFY